jgi:hypothetical protein
MGSEDGKIRVWSGGDRLHFRMLKGSTTSVYALAVGRDGTLWSGGGPSIRENGDEEDDSDNEDDSHFHVTSW